MANLAGSKISSRYRVVRLLGRGGMGEVYLAKHLHTGEMVALKVLLAQAGAAPQAVERFQREMRAPGRIKSDHVVRVTDADVAAELNGAPYLVMELLDGCDLQKPLKENRPYSSEEVVWIFGQIARALDKAHGLGIVHRDLKPENLFLHRKEETGLLVKILDFGIARLIEPQKWSVEAAKLTRTGALMGTPMYLSPEQAKGDLSQMGPPSDIWSLGMIAFELLTGKHYWEAESLAGLMAAILFAPMPPPSQQVPSLPKGFDAWFARSCDREPTNRWPTTSAQAEALAAALRVNVKHLRNLDAPASLRDMVQNLRPQEPAADEADGKELDDDGLPRTLKDPAVELRYGATRIASVQATQQIKRPRVSIAGIAGLTLLIATSLLAGYLLFHEAKPPPHPSPTPPVVVSPAQGTPTAAPSTPLVGGDIADKPGGGPVAGTQTSGSGKLRTKANPKKSKGSTTASGFEPEGR